MCRCSSPKAVVDSAKFVKQMCGLAQKLGTFKRENIL